MTENIEERINKAREHLNCVMPHIAGVVATTPIYLDDRVGTAAVTRGGRILLSPVFAATMNESQLAFVIAHEIYHVLYGVFERFDENTSAERLWLVNVAHDFIINSQLCCEFEDWSNPDTVPEGILDWYSYRTEYESITGAEMPFIDDYSLESLVLDLEKIKDLLPRHRNMMTAAGNGMVAYPEKRRQRERERAKWREEHMRTHFGGEFRINPFDVLASAGDEKAAADSEPESQDCESEPDELQVQSNRLAELLTRCDIPELISEEMEAELFPEEADEERENRQVAIEIWRETKMADDFIDRMKRGKGNGGGNDREIVYATGKGYRTPWEAALQKWVDDCAPRCRTWARASRRLGERKDICLPGHRDSEEARRLVIVLDTSGSMYYLHGRVLGAIREFACAAGLREVRILQCDAALTKDEVVKVDDLDCFEICGYGGSDMSPAMLKLAEDHDVKSVLVLTDGEIMFPSEDRIPYRVTWGVTDAEDFCPGYGELIKIKLGE